MSTILQSSFQSAELSESAGIVGAPFASTLNNIIPASTTNNFMGFFKGSGGSFTNFFTHTIPSIFQKPFTPMKIIIILLILLALGIAGYWFYNYIKSTANQEGFQSSTTENQLLIQRITTRTDSLRAGLNSKGSGSGSGSGSEAPAIKYIQPVCFKQASYISDNKFDSNQGILQQLRAGARTFFLQIDYLETDSLNTNNFCKSFEPCIMLRNNTGKLVSTNSSSISDIVKYLNEYSNNDTISFNNYPIVLLLHFVRLPYKMTDTDNYVNYLSKVASSINGLNLISGYQRSSKELELFSTNIHDFDKQVIVGTNIDTSLFTRIKKDKSQDLDFLTHFHYFEKDTETVDATVVENPEIMKANALIYNADTLLALEGKDQDKFVQLSKNKFIIVQTKPEQVLRSNQIDILLNTLQVNVIPYDYFSGPMNDAKSVLQLYGNDAFLIKTIQ